jgi:cysteine desulfurase/selenocysteine lyase
MEHHSNFVPWQQLALRKNANWKVWEFNEDGIFDLNTLSQVITAKTKIFAFTAVSNTFGTINPVKEIIEKARQINPDIIIIVDAAQAAPHTGINVADLDADFVAFSAHKMLGPTGVGVLWGKKKLLEKMPPYQFGGEMVLDVNIDITEFKNIPHKFEAGTPNIAGVVAFKAAIEYLQKLNFQDIHSHEQKLRSYAVEKLKAEFGSEIKLLGENNPQHRCGILSFSFEKYHSHDVAQILDESNIAVRAGHHCTMPLHKKLNIGSTTRASFYIYNTDADVDALIEGLKKVKVTFK